MQRIINQLCLHFIVVVNLHHQKERRRQMTTAAVNKSNDAIIEEYFEAMQTEINPSINYVKTNQTSLDLLLKFHSNKPLNEVTREDLISYLNGLKKSEDIDPLHKWIGTYNSRLRNFLRFFKWLYTPTLPPSQRPKPELLHNLPQLRRKELSIYKPTDLWTQEDDLVFLKWCSNKRDRCYHAISRDLSARPHEILNIRIKEVVFRQAGGKQFAEVLVNGKTGTRHLPLIDSLPYVKQWLDEHPRRSNRNSHLICSLIRSNVGSKLSRDSLIHIYVNYKRSYFPKLLKESTISSEDKQKIMDLLRKPWNLYIRRHSSLTQKNKFLKEHTLRQHAGWSQRSNMHLIYLHYFGNESSESILQEYGILPKETSEEANVLRPKPCPNCYQANRPDQKFCSRCSQALSCEAYQDMLKEQ
jgi:integrase/recombinase XerD